MALKSVAAVFCLGVVALMAPGSVGASQQFLGIDRDASNDITVEEAQAYRGRLMFVYDVNGDNRITLEEWFDANKTIFSNGIRKVPAEFSEADSNKDNILSLDEFLSIGMERFKKLNADGNGVISKQEFKDSSL